MFKNLLEGMSIWCLLYGLHYRFVNSESNGACQQNQWQIGEYTDDWETWDGQEGNKTSTKDNTRLFHIAPVNKGLHCKYKEKWKFQINTGNFMMRTKTITFITKQMLLILIKLNKLLLKQLNYILIKFNKLFLKQFIHILIKFNKLFFKAFKFLL